MRALIVTALAVVSLTACGREEKTAANAPEAPPAVPAAPGATITPTPAVSPESREFRDWRAACDNGNRCVAWGGSDSGWIRIAIDAGPEAVAVVSAGSWSLGDVGKAPDSLSLRIDGRDYALRPGPRDAANAQASAERTGQILAALPAARTLALASGAQTADLPASGVSAALLWIDERQGRLGTTTALLRRGDRPASAVPAGPALPRVTPAPAMSQAGFEGGANPMEDDPRPLTVPAGIEGLKAVKACRAEGNDDLNKAVLAARLDGSTVLWGIPCGSGAYNATYVLYLARPDGSGVRPAPLPERTPRTEGDIGGEGPWLVNPIYDPQRQTLTVFPRGRGLGDCGTITTWTWTAQGFVLSQERSMGDCWGMSSDLWPTLWRTRG
jgi:hypothetical protein